MFYIVECHIKCDEEVKEKLEAIIQKWKNIDLGLAKYRGEETSDEYVISGVTAEFGTNNVYSLPYIVEICGGILTSFYVKPSDDISEIFED